MVVVFLAIGDSQKCLISKSVEKLQVIWYFRSEKIAGDFSFWMQFTIVLLIMFHLGKLHYQTHHSMIFHCCKGGDWEFALERLAVQAP